MVDSSREGSRQAADRLGALLSEVAHQEAPQGPLSGLTCVAKDNINVAGVPATGGTAALTENMPEEDARIVAALRDAGANVIHKTNMHELSLGVTSNNAHTGPVLNPHDDSRVAGGSSGGSAAAVAVGYSDFALGTDTGGSVRLPASFCGIAGFRPSTGRYPSEGILGLSHTRDTAGIIARDLTIIDRVDEAITGEAPADAVPGLGDLRVGIATWAWQDLDPHVEQAANKAREALRAAGATLVDLSIDALFVDSQASALTIVLYETLKEISRYLDETGSNLRAEEIVEKVASPDVVGLFEMIADSPVSEEAYQAALQEKDRITGAYDELFGTAGVDLLMFPTVAMIPPLVSDMMMTEHNGEQVQIFPLGIRNLELSTVVGSPSISIPIDVEGLPVGMTFDGPRGGDKGLLAAAQALSTVIS